MVLARAEPCVGEGVPALWATGDGDEPPHPQWDGQLHPLRKKFSKSCQDLP